MSPTLPQLKHRIEELDRLAEEVSVLVGNSWPQAEISLKGQQWYRGARELMVPGLCTELAFRALVPFSLMKFVAE